MSIRAICVASHSDRPETETFIGLHRAGVDIEVICPPDAPHRFRLTEAGVPVTDLAIRGRLDRPAIKVLREIFQRKRPDILHAFTNPTISNSLLASRGMRMKIILYRGIVGNLSFLDPISYTTFLNSRVDRIVCVADAIRDFFLNMRLGPLRVPPERPVRIYKGHDVAWYNDAPADLARFGIPAGAFTVICVANNRPRKGVPVLVEACRLLPAQADIHLLLVGNGMDERKLGRAIAGSPMRERIHVPGFCPDAAAIAAASDVMVLPTLRREGLPRSVIEAMCYRTPPVVTSAGGSPELVVTGESGIVVPPGDAQAIAGAIVGLYEGPARRERMGEAARERIRTCFRIEDTIRQTHDLYRELVAVTAADAGEKAA